MLGFVKPFKAELKMREFQRYQSVYCALCKNLGRRFGQLKRLAVTYDATFLALFFLSFSEEEDCLSESCVANPLRKKSIAAPHPLIEFSADMTAILVSERGSDDWRDGQFFRAISEKALFGRAARKVKQRYPDLTERIRMEMDAFISFEKSEWEKAIPPGFTELRAESARRANLAAAYNGRMLRDIFLAACSVSDNPDLTNEKYISVISIFADHLGQWVYLMDAAEDQEQDIKHGRFSPFRGLERKACLELASELLETREHEMDMHAALLPYVKDAAIIQNIVTLGLPAERKRLLAGEKRVKV